MNTKFQLPPKIDTLLRTLNRLYEKQGESLLRNIIVNSELSIQEQWNYDNWNGGQYGHAINLSISEDLFLEMLDDKESIQDRVCKDINKIDNTHNEHIAAVFIEIQPMLDENWREQTGIFQPSHVVRPVPEDAQNRIWGDGSVRVFLSHISEHKAETAILKNELNRMSIAAFVAHEDIEPTKEWHKEIENALFSMDALVALLQPKFHDSNWTDQEVGVAIGRYVPVIPVCLGVDPYGLMGKWQGVRVAQSSAQRTIACEIFKILYKRFSDKSRLFDCALKSYENSSSFDESGWFVENMLSVFDKLSKNQINRLVAAFNNNDQNYRSRSGTVPLLQLLQKWTGKKWMEEQNTLVPENEDSLPEVDEDNQIPF